VSESRLVSVVIPARDEAGRIEAVVSEVLRQRPAKGRIEVIVVDDGSEDGTAAAAHRAGATVLTAAPPGTPGNPARARNLAVSESSGDPVVFLDADCVPDDGWLARLMGMHDQGEACVGGSLAMPQGLSFSARCDYYCSWYHAAPELPRGHVLHHPPGNLSVRRAVFLRTRGFTERHPVAYAHEELAWQGQLRRAGDRILFEPRARVWHSGRPSLGGLLRRSYRWGYSALEAKAASGVARLNPLYRFPLLLIALSPGVALVSTLYVVFRWLRVGHFEPLLMAPLILASRLAYSAGFARGGWRWRFGRTPESGEYRPRWE
jgi:glycosyltransferase involved in cell wall biosynthesis